MVHNERDWQRAIEQTWIVRHPRQHLATFGVTNISYFVVTEPVYQDPDSSKQEGVVRTGRVIAERPAIITPTYALNLEGFSPEAYQYLREVAIKYGPHSPGVLYRYRNLAEKMDIVSGYAGEIAHRISDDLDRRQENTAVVIVGVDDLWDVSLMKFIYEFTSTSAIANVREFQARGLLDPQPESGGLPRAAIQQIERLFWEAEHGADPEKLKQELDRWGVFEFYQDRFLNLFRRRL